MAVREPTPNNRLRESTLVNATSHADCNCAFAIPAAARDGGDAEAFQLAQVQHNLHGRVQVFGRYAGADGGAAQPHREPQDRRHDPGALPHHHIRN